MTQKMRAGDAIDIPGFFSNEYHLNDAAGEIL